MAANKGRFGNLAAETIHAKQLFVNGNSVAGGLLAGVGEVVDVNGNADAIVLDADGDTTISAPTDDQIDIEINSADDFRFTANAFTALSGSTIATDTIAETTAASGVTIDGVLLKDAEVTTDVIHETTPAAGVTIDSVQLKDGVVKSTPVEVTANGAITIPPGDTTYIITKAGVAAMTLADPAAGDNGKRLTFISFTANAHTLDNSAGSGFNAAGAGGDIGTWGGAIGDGLQLTAWGTKWLVNFVTNVTFA